MKFSHFCSSSPVLITTQPNVSQPSRFLFIFFSAKNEICANHTQQCCWARETQLLGGKIARPRRLITYKLHKARSFARFLSSTPISRRMWAQLRSDIDNSTHTPAPTSLPAKLNYRRRKEVVMEAFTVIFSFNKHKTSRSIVLCCGWNEKNRAAAAFFFSQHNALIERAVCCVEEI